jgi:hypothetical protein
MREYMTNEEVMAVIRQQRLKWRESSQRSMFPLWSDYWSLINRSDLVFLLVFLLVGFSVLSHFYFSTHSPIENERNITFRHVYIKQLPDGLARDNLLHFLDSQEGDIRYRETLSEEEADVTIFSASTQRLSMYVRETSGRKFFIVIRSATENPKRRSEYALSAQYLCKEELKDVACAGIKVLLFDENYSLSFLDF